MEYFLSMFSPYEIKARFFPAVLVLAPLVFSLLIWYPELIDWESSLFTLFIVVIIIFFLSKLGRHLGVKKQEKLLAEWGNFPSTIMLRKRDSTIDATTKERYHNFLILKVKGLKIPSLEEELEKPDFYEKQYNSAVKWLLENTRDSSKYSLLLQDNISYGFSRNLLGIKPLGIAFSLVSFVINLFGAYQKYNLILMDIPLKTWLAGLVCVFFTLMWIFYVTKQMVKTASYAYARTLLATCEDVV